MTAEQPSSLDTAFFNPPVSSPETLPATPSIPSMPVSTPTQALSEEKIVNEQVDDQKVMFLDVLSQSARRADTGVVGATGVEGIAPSEEEMKEGLVGREEFERSKEFERSRRIQRSRQRT